MQKNSLAIEKNRMFVKNNNVPIANAKKLSVLFQRITDKLSMEVKVC